MAEKKVWYRTTEKSLMFEDPLSQETLQYNLGLLIKGYTIAQLAERIDVSAGLLQKYLHGVGSMCRYDLAVMKKITEFLKISLDDLFEIRAPFWWRIKRRAFQVTEQEKERLSAEIKQRLEDKPNIPGHVAAAWQHISEESRDRLYRDDVKVIAEFLEVSVEFLFGLSEEVEREERHIPPEIAAMPQQETLMHLLTEEDWATVPLYLRKFLDMLVEEISDLRRRVNQLERSR